MLELYAIAVNIGESIQIFYLSKSSNTTVLKYSVKSKSSKYCLIKSTKVLESKYT